MPENKPDEAADFLQELEDGVLDILNNKKTSKADKLSAINAGVKLLAIRHRIKGDDSSGFFDK